MAQGVFLCNLNAMFPLLETHLPSQNPVKRVGQLMPVHFREKETEAQAGAQGQTDVSGRDGNWMHISGPSSAFSPLTPV